jgi:hypothetical protein
MGLAASAALGPLSRLTLAAPRFQVFDALLYSGRRDLSRYGIQPLPTLYNLWRPQSPHGAIDYTAMRAALGALPNWASLYFIDIEYWPLLQVSPSVRDSSISKFLEVAKIARSARPGARFGFYNVAPIGTYWAILMQQSKEYPEWLRANRALDPLAAMVDVLFPSLYTFYNEPGGWMTVAQGILAEARRYGKPVYPFLWPEFHDSNRQLAGQVIPADFWAAQLRFCRENADGVVLWGGYQHQWDENAAWWQTTREALGLTPK